MSHFRNTPTPDDRPAPRPRPAADWIEGPGLDDAWSIDPVGTLQRVRRELAVAVRQRCSDVVGAAGQLEIAATIIATDMEDLVR